MIPYYFDLPSLEIPQEIFDMPYVQHPSDFMSPSGKGQGGRTFQYRAVPTNWYGVVKEYLDNKVNLKFGAITLLNTEDLHSLRRKRKSVTFLNGLEQSARQ